MHKLKNLLLTTIWRWMRYLASAMILIRSLIMLMDTREKMWFGIETSSASQRYLHTKAALEIHKVMTKPESPFVKYFHIGVYNEGYWNSFHMVLLQLEDIVGCMLQVLHPEFDVVFLFDHSQGHSRKREGTLDANTMNQSYGGAQPTLRPTQSEAELGFLGPHNPCLKVGDV
jgi:hypothetical protein